MTKQRQPVAEPTDAGSGACRRRCWDIFCSVVDNFGDIGVCWRLARRLAAGLGQDVRLWVDDLGSFKRLRPAINVDSAVQNIDGIEVRHWSPQFPVVRPAQMVIEGFGVRLPDQYIEAMAAMHPAPVWINLEYLSAEAWVDEHGCHCSVTRTLRYRRWSRRGRMMRAGCIAWCPKAMHWRSSKRYWRGRCPWGDALSIAI